MQGDKFVTRKYYKQLVLFKTNPGLRRIQFYIKISLIQKMQVRLHNINDKQMNEHGALVE